MSVLLITHDLGVVASCDRVAAMYAKPCQSARSPRFSSVRSIRTRTDDSAASDAGGKEGSTCSHPGHGTKSAGLSFGFLRDPRRVARARDMQEEPPLREIAPNHFAACHFVELWSVVRSP